MLQSPFAKALSILLLILPPTAQAGDWPSYGADSANTKYAPLAQIDRNNFTALQVVWRWSLPNPHRGFTWLNQATPLCIDGVLYTSTPANQIAAIDGQSGRNRRAPLALPDPAPRPVGLLVHDPYLWAFDPADGSLSCRVELPGNANGAPITYMIDGKQYLAVPIGGGPQPAELVALALP